MKTTRIISAFPASGKTRLFKKGYDGKSFLDSDSSNFSWLESSERNPEFPDNYINHIKENIGKVDYILVSSHIDVRRALDESGLSWSFVHPSPKLMVEWIGRCYLRGNNQHFIESMITNWDKWLRDPNDPMPRGKCELQSNEFLEDKMYFLETITSN